MPFEPGSLPSGVAAFDPALITALANQLIGVLCALIVAVTWKG